MLGDNQAFKMASSGGISDVNIQYSDYFAGLEGPAKNNCLWPRLICLEKKRFLGKQRAAAERSISRYCEVLGIANLVGYKNPNEGLQIDGCIQFLCVWMGEYSLHTIC